MKHLYILLCVIIVGSANATTETTANQDKPQRLFVQNYQEGSGGYTTCFITSLNFSRTDVFSVGDSINWADGVGGTLSWALQHTETSPNSLGLTEVDNLTIAVSPALWPNTSGQPVYSQEIYTASTAPWLDFTNPYEGAQIPVALEHCDTSVPMVDGSGTLGPLFGVTYSAQATGSRCGQATTKLQTGGKATSKLRNLYGLTGSATQYDSLQEPGWWGYYEWSSEMPMNLYEYFPGLPETTIDSQNIFIGSYGSLGTSGVVVNDNY